MTRQVTDQLYVDLGYLTPEDYFVYTAEAQSAQAVSATVTADVGVIRGAASDLTVTSTVTATISNIRGADLFAFGNAALALQVSRIRNNNLAASSAFTIATDASRVLHFSADDFSTAAVFVGDNLRVRYYEAATSAAFSLTAELTRQPGVTVEASGAWTSQFDIDAKGSKKANIVDTDISCAFSQQADGDRIRFGTSLHEVQVFVAANVSRVLSTAATTNSSFSVNCANQRIRSIAASQTAAFSLTPNASKIVELGIFTETRTAKTIAPFGDVQNSTLQKKFGAGSVAFDGNGDYLYVGPNSDFQFGTAAFQFDLWVYRTTTATTTLIDFRPQTGTTPYQQLRLSNAGVLLYAVNGSFVITGNTIPLNTWTHVAISRSGTNTRMWINGSQAGATYTDSTNYSNNNKLTIGANNDGTSPFTGYIDEIRVSKGIARYTSTFTPATTAYVSDSNTVLLFHADSGVYPVDDVFVYTPQNVSSQFTSSSTASKTQSGSSALAVVCSTNALVNAIKQTPVSVSSSSSLFAVISHIEGADLIAFANASLSATVNPIKNNAASLNSNFAINLISEQFKNASASINASTNLSAAADRTRTFNVSLATNAQTVCAVAKTTLASAQINSNASVSAIGYILNKRPRQIRLTTGTPSFNSANKVIGTHSLLVPTNSAANYHRSNDFYIRPNEDFVIEAFINSTAYGSAQSPNIIAHTGYGETGEGGYWQLRLGGGSNRYLQFVYTDINDTVNTVSSNFTIAANTWYYVAVQKVGTTLYIKTSTYNGSTWGAVTTRSTTSVSFLNTWGQTPGSNYLTFGYVGTNYYGGYIDEFYYARGTNTLRQFAVSGTPNKIEYGADSATQALFHFDNSYVDDISGIVTAGATLSSSTNLTAQAQDRTKDGSANLTGSASLLVAVGRIRPFVDIQVSSSTLSVSGNVTKPFQASANSLTSVNAIVTKTFGPISADLNSATNLSANTNNIITGIADIASQGFVVAAFGRIRPFVDIQVSQFTLSAQPELNKVAIADLTANTTQTTTVDKQFGQQAIALQSTSNASATVNALPSGSVAMSSTSSVTISAGKIRFNSAAISAQAQIAAVGNVIRRLSSTVGATANLAANVYKIKQFQAQFASIVTEISVINKVGRTLVDCALVSNLNAVVKIAAQGSITLESTTNLVAAGNVTKPFASSVDATTELSVQAEVGLIAGADLSTQTQLAIDAVVTQSIVIVASSTTNLIANVGLIKQGISLEWSLGTLTAQAGIIKSAASNPVAITALTALAGTKQSGQANLQIQGFILALVRDINLNSAAVWIIPAETRLWKIAVDKDEWIVPFENRNYTIKGL